MLMDILLLHTKPQFHYRLKYPQPATTNLNTKT